MCRFFRFFHGSTLFVVLFKALIVNSSSIAFLSRSFLIFFCLCRPSYRAPYVLYWRGRSGPTVRVYFMQVIMRRSLEFVFLRNKLSCSVIINYHIWKVFIFSQLRPNRRIREKRSSTYMQVFVNLELIKVNYAW